MIEVMHDVCPELSLRRLCELTGTGRTWYYTHPPAEVVAARDVDLRDAIELLVLACPGYSYAG